MSVVDEALRLDALVPWLARRGVALQPPLSAHLLAGGRSNLTFVLTDALGRRIVVRRPPLGHVLPTAHDMAREHRMLARLHERGFPVPAPLALCEDDAVSDATLLVMEFVDGLVVATAAEADRLGSAGADRACASLVDTLALLHRQPVSPAEAERAAGYTTRQLERWRSQWSLTQVEPLPQVDALLALLAERIPLLPAGPAAVVHGDYRLDNAILDPQDQRVRAVLDWEMSTIGDPVMDLGVALVYWTQRDDRLRARVPVSPHATSGPGFWTRDAVIDRYLAQVDDPTAAERLDTCTALACLKLAVIMESIRMRTLRGEQRGVAAGDAGQGEATAALADLGLAVLEQGAVAGLHA